MKRVYLAAILATTMAGTAFAQSATTVVRPGAGESATITIAPTQRTQIRSYITEHKVRPVVVKEKVSVGTVLPSDVELLAIPEDWGPSLHSYRYVYSGDNVILVDPTSRRVVQIVD